MLSRVNSMVWTDGNKGEDQETTEWPQSSNTNQTDGLDSNKQDLVEMDSLSTFKSMLQQADEEDWYMANTTTTTTNTTAATLVTNPASSSHHQTTMHGSNQDISFDTSQLLLQPVDSSASCSPTPSSVFNSLDNHSSHHQFNYFLQQKPSISTFLNPLQNNPLEGSFDLVCGTGFLENGHGILPGTFNDLSPQSHMGALNLSPNLQFSTNNLLQSQNSGGFGGFGFAENSLFFNRAKILKPLDNFASTGSQPTLFQKRAASRKNLANSSCSNLRPLNLGRETSRKSLKNTSNAEENGEAFEANDKKRKSYSTGDELEDASIDGSNFNYDSDDQFLDNCTVNKDDESGRNGGNGSNANSTVTGAGGDHKGKKKGMPAKNLMAERRRRKKLNDRLYMLRSVVPRISKMDRASILGDAIEYLKELLQKISDLQHELESTPASSSLTPGTSFYPLTPTTPGLSSRIKEELCTSAFASPLSSPTGQPARVEVRLREGRAMNIHMFCGRRPGLLLSTMKALDNLGLDIQQAVISCFNGFALDIFRAEQCNDGQDLHPDHIKAVLLDSAGFHGLV